MARQRGPALTAESIGRRRNPRTAAESTAAVTPSRYAYDVTPYGDLFRYMTDAQRNSIQGDGSVDTTTGWQNAMLVAAAANGITIVAPAGNYKNTAIVDVPRYVTIRGAGCRRGFGTPPAAKGTSIQVAHAGPAFRVQLAVNEPVDVLVEHMNIDGNSAVYGVGNGIEVTKASGTTWRELVVSDFGEDNVRLGSNQGEYNNECERVYSAGAGSKNFNVNSQYSRLSRCLSDGGGYGAYVSAGGDHVTIDNNCHFEGPSIWGIFSVGGHLTVENAFVRLTRDATGGIYPGAVYPSLSFCRVFGDDGVDADGAGPIPPIVNSYGIRVPIGALGAIIVGCSTLRVATGLSLEEGYNAIVGNIFSGTGVGVDMVGGNYRGIVAANTIDAPIPLRHSSGSKKFFILGNNPLDGTAAPSELTVTAGTAYQDGEMQRPMVSAFRAAVQSVPNTTYTAVTLDSEEFDTHAMHDTAVNPSRLVAPFAGKYRVTYFVQWAPHATGIRTGRVRVNATLLKNLPLMQGFAADENSMTGSFTAELAKGDYVELEVYQSSGGALDMRGGANANMFQLERVGD